MLDRGLCGKRCHRGQTNETEFHWGEGLKNSWGITVMILKRHTLGIQDIVEICQGDKEYPAILGKIGINPGSEIQTFGKASDVKEVSHSGNTPETSRKALDVE